MSSKPDLSRTVISMTNRVARGESADKVVLEGPIVPEPGDDELRYICSVCGSHHHKSTPSCSCRASLIVSKGELEDGTFHPEVRILSLHEMNKDRPLSLGHLRPRDRFKFVDAVPGKSIDTETEYAIVSAERGYLTFTSGYRLHHTLHLVDALAFPIEPLFNPRLSPTKKVYPGDQVLYGDNQRGEIISRARDNCRVRDAKTGEDTWVPVMSVKVVDREKTTKNYIKEVSGPQGRKWVVSYADYSSIHPTFLEAIKALHKENRTAFNRLSRMMAYEKDHRVQGATLTFLRKKDPSVWGHDK